MTVRQHGRNGWIGATIVALALTLGCGAGEPTGTPPGSERLELNVSVSQNEFIRGDSTIIVVTLQNISNERVRVSFETTCTIIYGIRQAGGPVVVPSGGQWICPPNESTLDLNPSEFAQRRYVWKGVSAPAGDYLVFGALGPQMDPQTAPVSVRLIDTP